MKKTIIISAIALCFSLVTNAKTGIDNGNSYQVESVFKVSPLCASIAKGDFVTVKKLVDLGADVNDPFAKYNDVAVFYAKLLEKKTATAAEKKAAIAAARKARTRVQRERRRESKPSLKNNGVNRWMTMN